MYIEKSPNRFKSCIEKKIMNKMKDCARYCNIKTLEDKINKKKILPHRSIVTFLTLWYFMYKYDVIADGNTRTNAKNTANCHRLMISIHLYHVCDKNLSDVLNRVDAAILIIAIEKNYFLQRCLITT